MNLHFMVTEREREQIAEKMELAGIRNMGAYLRKMAIDGYVVKLDLSDVRELVSLLRSVSNNINQIAHRANEARSIYEADIQDLRARYNQLWEAAKSILKELAELS